jgi:methionyl-tRNA synthetase
MLSKYFNGIVQEPGSLTDLDLTYRQATEEMVRQVERHLDDLAFSKALQAVWEVISAGNKYIDDTAPWTLAKDPAQKERLGTIMYCLLESQRIVHSLLSAFLPSTAEKALCCLGVPKATGAQTFAWGGLAAGTSVRKAEPLFPRIEDKEE